MKRFSVLACFLSFSGLIGLPIAASAQIPSTNATQINRANLNPADQNYIQQTEQWINHLTTLRGRFQQIAPNGTRSTGVIWINRPGRIRFQYDQPSKMVLVANEGKIVFYDGEVDQTTIIPVDQSPLGLLLKPQLSFSGDVSIIGFNHSNGFIQITLVRTRSPNDGNLTLVFYENPLQLRSWRVVDAQGQETQVDLFDIKFGASAPENLFNIHIGDNN